LTIRLPGALRTRGKWICLAALAVTLLATATSAHAAPRGCDPLDPAACLLPWPNDYFRKNGRLALTDAMMPRSKEGTPIQASDYNRSDGFSPGQIIVTLVPGVDLRQSGAAPITNIGRSLGRRQPIVVIDAKTLKRQPIWSELNSLPENPAERTLNISPAVGWREGRRYIVALRNLKNAQGQELGPGRAFRRFRDGRARGPRAAHMEDVFNRLRRAGIARRDLYLAWDFTVASRRNLTQRLLFMRDRAFAGLGDRNLRDLKVEGSAPSFSIDEVRDAAGGRRIAGRVAVPCFLDQPGCPPGSRFRLDRRGLPVRAPGNVQQARFVCFVPSSATPSNRARPLLFGHGLFQNASIVDAASPVAVRANAVMCGTDWSGLSSEDVQNAISVSGDLSRLPTLADRLQQGVLNFMFLGRLMVHPQGLSSNPEFAGKIDTSRLYYSGVSLGGIIGGAYTAVAPDSQRSALIVPGFRFSLLLTRSVDFSRFAEVVYPTYPDRVDQAVINSLTQLVWDRGEPSAYAWHMTRDPLPNTPRHTVLLHEAFGDHQVPNIATETLARVVGARLRTPALDPGRSLDKRPFYGIDPVPRYPWTGNALLVFDIGPLRPAGCGAPGAPGCLGTPPPPTANQPPTVGVNPHAITLLESTAVDQFVSFLAPNGAFINNCGAQPCYAAGWAGP
jgi:hypothetical protein